MRAARRRSRGWHRACASDNTGNDRRVAVSRHSGQAGTGLGEQSGASLLRWSSHPETSLFGRGPWPRPSGSPAMKARLLAAGRALRLAAGIIGASHTSRAIGTGSHAFTVLGRGLSAPGGARGRYPIGVGLRHRAVARIRVVGGFRAVVVLQGGDSARMFLGNGRATGLRVDGNRGAGTRNRRIRGLCPRQFAVDSGRFTRGRARLWYRPSF